MQTDTSIRIMKCSINIAKSFNIFIATCEDNLEKDIRRVDGKSWFSHLGRNISDLITEDILPHVVMKIAQTFENLFGVAAMRLKYSSQVLCPFPSSTFLILLYSRRYALWKKCPLLYTQYQNGPI